MIAHSDELSRDSLSRLIIVPLKKHIDKSKDEAYKYSMLSHFDNPKSIPCLDDNFVTNDIESKNILDILYKSNDETSDIINLSKIPKNSKIILRNFTTTERYRNLKIEYKYIQQYIKSFNNVPFKVQFMTTDAIIRTSPKCICPNKEKIILIERNSEYGNGKLAMVGGFLEEYKSIYDNNMDEIYEEIGLSKSAFKRIDNPVIIDTMNRSLRGRTLSFVHNMKTYGEIDTFLPNEEVQKVLTLTRNQYESLPSHRFFDDHHLIIEHVIGWKLTEKFSSITL
jgi:ADP-ribose pyrophosphatase YjhB (NUDIX family)